MADQNLDLAGIKDSIDKLPDTVKSFVDKAKEEQKSFTEEQVNKVKLEIEQKSAADIKVLSDEMDRQRKAYEESQAKAATSLGQPEQKSFNKLLEEAIVENTDEIAKFERKEKGYQKSVTIEMKAVGDMTVSANYTGGSVMLTNARPGIIQLPRRKMHVRDIPELPKGTTTGTRFDYLKENGAGEGAIAPVAETGTKPQIDLDLVEASAPVEVIAGWLRISNKMLNNVPGLISFLQSRLLEKLLIVEDDQLINGNGTSPNISGIADTGNHTVASAAQTLPKIEQLVFAISQLEELNRNPDAILLRPSDFWSIALTKSGGSEEYDLPGMVNFSDGQLRIAGIPAYRTTAMTADQFIVGDFGMGAMLLQRTAPRIEIFREDGTNVRENKVTVRVEEEIAFPIFGSDFFIYDDFTV